MLEKQSKTKQNKTKKASKLSVQKEEQQKKDPKSLSNLVNIFSKAVCECETKYSSQTILYYTYCDFVYTMKI